MDYTTNHHLPQWVKSDRIMMDDFNQMCRDIEAGLTKGQNNLAATEARLAGRIAQTEQTVGTLSPKNDLFSGLYHAAYNRLHLAAKTPSAYQLGAFVQHFGRSAGSNVSGMLQREDCSWMANGAAALSLDNTRSSIVFVKGIDASNRTLALTFTTPYSGILQSLRLLGTYYNAGSAVDAVFRVRLRLNNTVVEERRLLRSMARGDGTLRETVNDQVRDCYTMPLDMIVHSGMSYKLEVTMDNGSITPNFYVDPRGEECLVFSGMRTGTASIQRTIAGGEVRLGGLALVHYNAWSAGGGPSLIWDGVTMQPAVTRTVTGWNGQQVREAEFRRSTSVPANSTIRLTMSCNAGGDVSLYGWGAALL